MICIDQSLTVDVHQNWHSEDVEALCGQGLQQVRSVYLALHVLMPGWIRVVFLTSMVEWTGHV